MTGTCTIYTTCATALEAQTIAKSLVKNKLAACVNILPGVQSIYRWQGDMCEDQEIALLVKTRSDLAEAVIDAIKALHSYDCPCIVVWPIVAGNPAYLQWVDDETTNA